MSFTHLHLHTLYSLLDGAIRMKDLVKTIKEKGMSSVAVTDHGNMFGTIDFYKKAKDAGIKPIIGMEAYVAGAKGRQDKTEKVAHHLILLATNDEGYRNLRYLSSTAYLDGFYYHPRIDKSVLKDHSKGLVGLTACLGGEVTSACFRGDMDNARRAAQEYKSIFDPGHFFLEIQSNGLAEQDRANENLKQLSRDLEVPLCATADAHYIKREDAKAHELLMCIASGKTLADNKRMRHSTDKLYVTSPEEMLQFFSDCPEAVHNTQRIAEMCNLELKLGKPMLPTFKVPDCHTADSYMAELATRGLEERFKELPYKVDREVYLGRLGLELSVIASMGFSGYFLIVQDFINWAKRQNIPVGPGRGSGAGSLVAYALRITDLDPLPYNLLFERFLNPERVSMPDFDIDFCQTRRDEVIHYVGKKYGESNVGQIITFGSLKAKSVLRDVCRVFGLPYSEGDRLAKLVPEVLNITLKDAIEMEPRLKEMMEKPSVLGTIEGREVTSKDVLEIALALEGLHRQAGMHAAGVVIADKPLWEFVPVYQPPGENVLITQFAKDEVEAAGLVKFDFLGLKTLTVIQHAIDLVNRHLPDGEKIERHKIPLADPETYALISRGDTAGVFQMESSGFTEMVIKLKPSCFEDVIAAGALYRPGPLDAGMVEVFINRKHGREKVSYPHPLLETVLKDTYGVIVYQEQVMQISQILGGYTLGRADLLRRAMGKKKAEVMQQERAGFLEGCQKNGVDPKVAGEIFDLMEKFAEYGFNKSHSAAYGLITVHTAWLKAHHPVEFMAALLTSEKDNTDKVVMHIAEARAAGHEVLPPDINHSELQFSAVDGKIRFGLGAIKGVGEAAIEAILEARTSSPFTDLFDFCERVDGRRVNRKVLEALVKAGAFDFEKRPRRQLFESIDKAMGRGSNAQRDREVGQSSLFGLWAPPEEEGKAAAGAKNEYVAVEEWTEKERLSFEKEAIGFYVSGHPLHQYEKELRRYARPLADVQRARRDEKVTVAGIVAALRERPTKTGKRMAWVTLEDLSGSLEIVCFPSKDGSRSVMGKDGKWGKQGPKPGFDSWEVLLKSDEPLLVTGTVQINNRDEETPVVELIAEEIQSLKEVRDKRVKRLELKLLAGAVTEDRLLALTEIAEKHAGATPVAVSILFPGEAQALIGETRLKVSISDELLFAVDKLFGGKVAEMG
jgi:DNA polymerase-3 subunit alpha